MVKFLIKLALKIQRKKYEFFHKAGVKLTAAARWHESQVTSADAAAAEKFTRALDEAKKAKQIASLL